MSPIVKIAFSSGAMILLGVSLGFETALAVWVSINFLIWAAQ